MVRARLIVRLCLLNRGVICVAVMRYLLAVAYCATLTAAEPGQLRQLEETHRMFAVRTMLEQAGGEAAGALAYYRAITTSRFGHEREAIGQFRAFLATKPAPEMEVKARYELSSALTWLGEYGQAATELAAALRQTPDSVAGRADSGNVKGLLESLRDVAAPSVEFGPPAPVRARRNQLGIWEVPVEIGPQHGEWLLDTGANFSTVTESEARRMGLAIRDVQGYARGFTDAKTATRLAVASELRFGAARLHNVVFLVLPDQALLMAHHQIQGILGFPAMRSLGRLEVAADGAIALNGTAKAGPAQEAPNLFFDGLNPIVQVAHLGKQLQMMLDTGLTKTLLYPSMRDVLAPWERNQLGGSRAAVFSGGGGSERREADFVPNMEFAIRGRTFYLQGLNLLGKGPAGKAEFRDGILGMDALTGGFILDFHAMEFRLQ